MENPRQGPHIATIGGSVRPGNYTWQALAVVLDEIRKHPDFSVEAINPIDLDLPLPGADNSSPGIRELQQSIDSATGVILATPEYHGSYSSIIKLVIENLGFPSLLKGKPVALLGVAAGRVGAITALEHLRSVCAHVGAIVLPGMVSVAGVQRVFSDKGEVLDPVVDASLRSVATSMMDYIHGSICPRIALEEMMRQGWDGKPPVVPIVA